MTFETNVFRAATSPVSLCTSFTFLGEVMSSMALTFSRLASIPHWETVNPRNLPNKTPNTHFAGFSLI